MDNFGLILRLVYKKVSAQNVIDNKIRYDCFSEEEFLKMSTAYIFHYSENEICNMLRTYTRIFQKEYRETELQKNNQLNVFEALSYFSRKILTIRKNEVLCHYERLLEWREMLMELSEDTIITAFLSRRFTPVRMSEFGFCWKQVIGHDNFELYTLMQRKVSENHFHLMCSGAIFQISWLSLMNHADDSYFISYLREYDENRRYNKVSYSNSFQERSLYEQYLQAALIRILLYSRLSEKRITIGSYAVKGREIVDYLYFPPVCYCGKELVWKKPNVKIRLLVKKQVISFTEIISELCKYCLEQKEYDQSSWKEFLRQNCFLSKLLESRTGKIKFCIKKIELVLDSDVEMIFSELLRQIFCLMPVVFLEDLKELFCQPEIYDKLMEERTLENVNYLLKHPEFLFMERSGIQATIDALRMNAIDKNVRNIPDYILNEKSLKYMDEGEYTVFAGERWLMYMMFWKNYNMDRSMEKYYNLFYAYLLIKERIRSELVQTNSNVGLANFKHYQKRKMDLLMDSSYQNLYVRQAVRSSLFTKNIQTIELRIVPGSSVQEQAEWIQRLDDILDSEGRYKKKFFYTIHFLKRQEEIFPNMFYHCRHYRKRKEIKEKAKMLIDFRERYPNTAKRVLGIDAASNEIGCRPEVFAAVFRELGNHIHPYFTIEGRKYLPQLNITYHVGEDFLDMADGLRAIEEAVLFLDLASGDRLGHALALGIDVMEWYERKNYKIELPVQDYIDNIMWMYHKLFQFNICGFENLKEQLQSEFTVLFDIVYNINISPDEISAVWRHYQRKNKNIMDFQYFPGNGGILNMEIFTYYNAWQLRGDDPELYKLGYFDKRQYQKTYGVNNRCPREKELREVPEVAFLYYSYHYNEKIRKAGAQTKEITISKSYAKAVAAIQKAMQKEIAALGIAIETNPTSNYMIGTFRRYDKHPLVQFYNKGLVHDAEKLKQCPQISVSINTDDQGVFGISLENEYALIACAMESLKNEQEQQLYSRDDIYEWLDKIRIMGNEQSFVNFSKIDNEKIGNKRQGV